MKPVQTRIVAAAALAVALPLMLNSPAWAERTVFTPSGLADATFDKTSQTEAAAKLANHCMNKGWAVASQSGNQVVCEVPMNTMKTALMQVLVGNRYSTTPRSYVKFSVAQIGENSRAQGTAWVETQMAFGQVRQQPFIDDTTYEQLLGFMVDAGGRLPAGTTFAGIYLGVQGAIQSDGKKAWRNVDNVMPGSPAEAAQLKSGDKIIKVGGRSFTDLKSWNKALFKFAPGVRFPLDVLRDGRTVTLQVEGRAMPTVGTPEYDWFVQTAKQASAVASGQPE